MNEYEPNRRIESDDERLTREEEQRKGDPDGNNYDWDDDDDVLYCDSCGRATKYDFEQGGYVCDRHGLQ